MKVGKGNQRKSIKSFDDEKRKGGYIQMLHYSNNVKILSSYTVIQWLEKMQNYVQTEYGDIHLIFDVKDPRYPSFKIERVDTANLSERQIQMLEELAIKDLYKKQKKMEEDKVKVYGLIWGQLSKSSQAMTTKDAGYELAKRDSDPLSLLKIVRNVHLTYGATTKGRAKKNIISAFTDLEQGDDSLHVFFQKFEAAITALKMIGAQAYVDDEDILIEMFMSKLNPKVYGEAMRQYENQIGSSSVTFDTYLEAYEWLMTYKKNRTDKEINRVYKIAEDSGEECESEEEESEESECENRKVLKVYKRGKGWVVRKPCEEHPCAICKKPDHWVKDCPENPDNEKGAENQKSKTEVNQAKRIKELEKELAKAKSEAKKKKD